MSRRADRGRRGPALRPSVEAMEARELLSAMPRLAAGRRPAFVQRHAPASRPPFAGPRRLAGRPAVPAANPPAPNVGPTAPIAPPSAPATPPPGGVEATEAISGTFTGLYDARSSSLRLSGPGTTNGASGAFVDARLDPDGGVMDLTVAGGSGRPVHLKLQGAGVSAADPQPARFGWQVHNGPGGGSGGGTATVTFEPYRTGPEGTGRFTLQVDGRLRQA